MNFGIGRGVLVGVSRLANEIVEKRKGALFGRAGGFFHQYRQASHFGGDRIARQKADARGQDRRLDDRMLGTIETDEIAQHASLDNVGRQAGAGLAEIALANLEREPPARIGQDETASLRGADEPRQLHEPVDGGARQKLDVIRDVKYALPAAQQVFQRRRSLVGRNVSRVIPSSTIGPIGAMWTEPSSFVVVTMPSRIMVTKLVTRRAPKRQPTLSCENSSIPPQGSVLKDRRRCDSLCHSSEPGSAAAPCWRRAA